MNPPQWAKASLGSAVRRLKVRSALNPCLWMVGAVTPTSIVCSVWLHGFAQLFVISLGLIPVVVCCFMLIWFSIKDPIKLRSERHEEWMELVNLVEQKGGTILRSNDVEDTFNFHVSPTKQGVNG